MSSPLSWRGGRQASGIGRRSRFRVRSVLRRSLERVVHARCVLPRGQDRLPPVGHEDLAHRPERRGPLRPRRRRAYGLTPGEYQISLAAPYHGVRSGFRLHRMIRGALRVGRGSMKTSGESSPQTGNRKLRFRALLAEHLESLPFLGGRIAPFANVALRVPIT